MSDNEVDTAPEIIEGIRALHARMDELRCLVEQRLETDSAHAAIISIVTVALVVARAVGLLP
jgi:hypothetical protein